MDHPDLPRGPKEGRGSPLGLLETLPAKMRSAALRTHSTRAHLGLREADFQLLRGLHTLRSDGETTRNGHPSYPIKFTKSMPRWSRDLSDALGLMDEACKRMFMLAGVKSKESAEAPLRDLNDD